MPPLSTTDGHRTRGWKVLRIGPGGGLRTGLGIGGLGIGGLALTMLLATTACSPPPPAADFRSPDPASRLLAIEDAARRSDRTAIPHLIESLDSADPAVRFMAFQTLRTMTGEECGYREGDSPERRAEAIACWEELARREGWAPELVRKRGIQEPPA